MGGTQSIARNGNNSDLSIASLQFCRKYQKKEGGGMFELLPPPLTPPQRTGWGRYFTLHLLFDFCYFHFFYIPTPQLALFFIFFFFFLWIFKVRGMATVGQVARYLNKRKFRMRWGKEGFRMFAFHFVEHISPLILFERDLFLCLEHYFLCSKLFEELFAL